MGDLILNIGKLIKEYETNSINEINDSNKEEILYSINQVIELYPLLSKHIITNAINNGELEVTWIGNKRYFHLDDIDYFLKNKQDKNITSIPDTIKSWRNHS